jgi:hypothetical protein
MDTVSNPATSRNASPPRDISADVTDKLVLPEEGIREFIRRRPAVAIGGALLAGFLLAKVASRF